MEKYSISDEILQKTKELNELVMQDWLHHVVFSPKWWLLLILTIVPWFVWWRLVDKSRIVEIFLYGLFIMGISTLLDVIGWNYSFWFYPITLLGNCTPLVPIDYTLLIICYMMLYQYCSNWKRFVLVLLVMSACFAFVLEPLTEMMDFYKPLTWHHSYSVLGYMTIGVFFKWLVAKIIHTQREAGV